MSTYRPFQDTEEDGGGGWGVEILSDLDKNKERKDIKYTACVFVANSIYEGSQTEPKKEH